MQKTTEQVEKEIEEWFLGHGDVLFRLGAELRLAMAPETSPEVVFKTLENAMLIAMSDAATRFYEQHPGFDSEGNPLRE